MKKIIISIVLTMLTVHNYAQAISGKVVDQDNKAVDYATVILLTTDSIYIEATVTSNSGTFSFTKTADLSLIRVDHLLYEPKVESSSSTGGYDTIVVRSKSIEVAEVVVKGERPLVKVEGGRLIYDLEQISKNRVVSNAYESILQIPGVREQGGSLILAGSDGVTIIIDGKPTTMSIDAIVTLLKNTPISRVEKAEVMYSAPAKYHVKGAAINIVMKSKFKTDGIQGEVTGRYGRQIYNGGGAGVSLLYSSDKITTDLLYNIDYDKSGDGMDIFSNHYLTQTDVTTHVEQYNIGTNEKTSHNIRYGLDYHISENKRVNLTYTGQFTPDSQSVERSIGSIYSSTNNHSSSNEMHNIDMSYSSSSNSGSTFRAGANFTSYKFSSLQNLANIDLNTNIADDILSYAEQNIDKLQLYIDKEHTLSKGWKLNYGTLFNYTSNNNTQTFNSSTDPNIAKNNSSSSLKEGTYNLYAGVEKSLSDKLSTSISMTGEYYKIGDYERWSLLPSAQVAYTLSPNHILQWALSSDKKYPNYWELQESVSYFNKYAELIGNPLLVPSLNYSSQLTYILNQKYTATLYYSHTVDHFEQLAYQSPDRLILIYQTINSDFLQTVGINFGIPFSISSVVNSTLTLNGFNISTTNNNFHDISYSRDKWVGYARLDNSFNISTKPNIKLELSGYYITDMIQGIYDMDSMWGVDTGAKWIFAGERASLGIKVTDIFNSFTPKLSVDYQGQDLKMNIRPVNRYGHITLSYKLGGYKAKDRKKVNTSRFRQ